jgi:hypothetical protein
MISIDMHYRYAMRFTKHIIRRLTDMRFDYRAQRFDDKPRRYGQAPTLTTSQRHAMTRATSRKKASITR